MKNTLRSEVLMRPVDVVRAGSHDGLTEWELLLNEGSAGSVYLHPHLVMSDLKAYRDSRVCTLTDTDDQLKGVAVLCPKTILIRPLSRLLGSVKLEGYRLVGDQVVTAGGDEALHSIVRTIAGLLLTRETKCLYFEDIEVGSPLWLAIHHVAAQERSRIAIYYPNPAQPHHQIRFPGVQAEYWKHFSGKSRYNLRRQANKFDHRLVVSTSPDQVPDFLEKAHAISTKSWQTARLGLRIRNSPEEREFWGMIASFGAFRSYILEHQGIAVAFVIGTSWNGYYTYEEVAYDPEYARHSPGTVLLYRQIEDLIARDTPRVLDFGFGDAEYKRLFSTHQTQSGPIMLVRRAFNPMVYLRLHQLTTRITRSLKAAALRSGILRYFRRRFRKPRKTTGE